MEDLSKFLEAGKEKGISGKDLLEFVEKRDAVVREETKERQKYEREERMQERELHQKQIEIEQQKEQSVLKLQLVEKEIELAKINASHKKDAIASGSEVKAKLPKLPAFCDGKDNMDAYLKRFEKFAANANWPVEKWATNLSALLQGKALDVYSRLSPEEAKNYEKLRDALLKRYQLTEEGFRQKFRTSKQETGETAGQFVIRLKNYLARWMELGKVPESFEGLRDLLLREQFLTVSNKNLVLFLKERKIKSVNEMTELAEQYMEAHTVSEVYRSPSISKAENRGEFGKKSMVHVNAPEGKNLVRDFKERYCYGCGKKDHFIKNCPSKTAFKPNTRVAALEVQKEGDEENSETEGEKADEVSTENTTVATCMVSSITGDFMSTAFSTMKAGVQIKSTNNIPLANISRQELGVEIKDSPNRMPVKMGYIGNVKISVLRDSGCNSAIIRENLIQPQQLTGNSLYCTLADGTRRKFPVAVIEVNTPYFIGKIEALCMPKPVYDLVLGNIQGVRSADNPDTDWNCQPTIAKGKTMEANAVETRAQKIKQKKQDTLKVPDSISEYTVSDLVSLQAEDSSLAYIKDKAVSAEVKLAKNGSSVQYIQKKGLYYRQYKAAGNNGREYNQLIVPAKLRGDVLKIAHDGIMSGHLG